MSRDERTGWLATLRRHDEVGVLVPDSCSLAADGCVCRIGVVESVTSAGRITVGGWHYGPDGTARGFAREFARDRRLIPASEARERITHDEAHHEAIVALRLAALGLSEAVRERRAQRLTTSAAQQLTVQIGALTEALRVALNNETPPSAAKEGA